MKPIENSSRKDDAVIKVSHLKKTFGDLTAVNDLSFEVFKGEIFGFLGPNGAGKTTSINMICGLSEPTAGDVMILGNEKRNRTAIKAHIGICPQENIFWPKLTCLEQLIFMGQMYDIPGPAAKKRANELLAWMGLQKKAGVLAHKLSGGMKRRLSICLALVHDPEVLILDEPEAGLDPQSRILVREFIKSLASEKTIILTTHNMDEAERLAHRVAIIDYGRLLLLDTPRNLKKSIGEGDVLEIHLEMKGNEVPGELVDSLRKISGEVNVRGESLILISRNLLGSAAEVTERIKKHGLKIKEMTMRENTLEDVFIHLTGRKLRQ
jgi:ABC-2 type transport system ATP-binding protein